MRKAVTTGMDHASGPTARGHVDWACDEYCGVGRRRVARHGKRLASGATRVRASLSGVPVAPRALLAALLLLLAGCASTVVNENLAETSAFATREVGTEVQLQSTSDARAAAAEARAAGGEVAFVFGTEMSGLSNDEIASRLVISLATVKRHISNIYGKLDVPSRTQAIFRARELKLID